MRQRSRVEMGEERGGEEGWESCVLGRGEGESVIGICIFK